MALPHPITALEERLQQPLPGQQAQRRMMPAPKGTRINPENQRFNSRNFPNAKQSAVLILLFPQENRWYFPLIKRPTYPGAHSGQISFPGGAVEDTDTSRIQTALRETREEVGVPSEQIKVLGTLTELYIPASNFLVLPVVGYAPEKPLFIPDNHEVEQILEAPLSQLAPTQIRTTEMSFKNGMQLTSPYYDIHGHTVWGATAMMLAEFEHITSELF